MKASLVSVTPMIPTGDAGLEEAVHFYTAHMGFEVTWRSETMAGLARNGIAFNLIQNDNREWAESSSFSIEVAGLDELFEEYRGIPARVGPLEVKPWGRREFHLIVPSGLCFQFYESAGV